MACHAVRWPLALTLVGAGCSGDDGSGDAAGSATATEGADDGGSQGATSTSGPATTAAEGTGDTGNDSGGTSNGSTGGDATSTTSGDATSTTGGMDACTNSRECPDGSVCIADPGPNPGEPAGPFYCSRTCAGLGPDAAICTDDASCCGAFCLDGFCTAP